MAPNKKKTENDSGARKVVEGEQTAVAVLHAPRLPYSPMVQDHFGIDKMQWRSLVEAQYPNAKTIDAIILVLSYCKSRNLDPMKKPVHIVPMYSSALGKMVDTVWPGIAEIRTTATRTGQYAGCDEAEFGEDVTETFKGELEHWDNGRKVTKHAEVEVTYPEWCRFTVYKIVAGQRVKFVGPKVKWVETYATAGRNTPIPNSMWQDRPEGQLEKCAEAAALRRAFPEELGATYSAEEMEGKTIDSTTLQSAGTIAEAIKAEDGPPNPDAPAKVLNGEVLPPEKKDQTPRDAGGQTVEHDQQTGEVDDDDDAPPHPDRSPAQDRDDQSNARGHTPEGSEDDDMGSDDADPEPSKRVEPFEVPTPKGTTRASWTNAFLDGFETSETMADFYKWIDLNHKHLKKAATDPDCDATIKRSQIEMKKKLEAARDEAQRKNISTGTVQKEDAARPGVAARGSGKGKADNKVVDGVVVHADKGFGVPPVDPDEWLKWVDTTLATVTDADDLSDFWERVIAPSYDGQFPGDQTKAVAIYDRHEKRLGID